MSTNYSYPTNMKKLRACIGCKLLKTESQWNSSKLECENCGQIRDDNITSNFKGIIAFTDPKHSWAGKWLSRTNIIPGLYCIYVDEIDDNDLLDEYEKEDEEEEEQ